MPKQAKYTVVMSKVGSFRINVIKILREVKSGCKGYEFAKAGEGWGLKEAHDFVSGEMPSILVAGVTRYQANKVRKYLASAGAETSVIKVG